MQFSGVPANGIDDMAFLYPQAPPDLSDAILCEKLRAWATSSPTRTEQIAEGVFVLFALGLVVLALVKKNPVPMIVLGALAFVFGLNRLAQYLTRRDWRGYVDLIANPANYQVRKGRIAQIQIMKGDFSSPISPAWIQWKFDANQGYWKARRH